MDARTNQRKCNFLAASWVLCFSKPIFNFLSFSHWTLRTSFYRFHNNSQEKLNNTEKQLQRQTSFLMWSLSVWPHFSHILEDVWVVVLFTANFCHLSFRGCCESTPNSEREILVRVAACYLALQFSAGANYLSKGYRYPRAEHLKFISIQHMLTKHPAPVGCAWGPAGSTNE